MANYSLVSGAKFTPFTFDEMVKPLQMYKEYYDQQEAILTKLEEDAAEWGRKAEAEQNSQAAKTYKQYQSDITSMADRLGKTGMSPELRRDIKKMRSRYTNDILPIRDAYNWRLQQIQNEMEGKAKGIVYNGDASTTSLDEYIKNPSLVHGFADSNAGYARVANAAQAIARGLSQAKITGKLDDYTKELLIQSGYNVNDVTTAVAAAIRDLSNYTSNDTDSKAAVIIGTLLHNEQNAAGIHSWGKEAQSAYLSKVAPALYNLIGQANATPMEDYKTRKNAELSNQIAVLQESHRLNAEEAENAYNYKKKLKEIEGGSGSSSGGYNYDRPDGVYKDGKFTHISNVNGKLVADGKRVDIALTPIKFSVVSDFGTETDDLDPTKPKTIAIEKGGKLIAKITLKKGENGSMTYEKGFSAKDLNGSSDASAIEAARAVADNPGSLNQYNMYINDNGGIVSIQNSAKRTTDSNLDYLSLWEDATSKENK